MSKTSRKNSYKITLFIQTLISSYIYRIKFFLPNFQSKLFCKIYIKFMKQSAIKIFLLFYGREDRCVWSVRCCHLKLNRHCRLYSVIFVSHVRDNPQAAPRQPLSHPHLAFQPLEYSFAMCAVLPRTGNREVQTTSQENLAISVLKIFMQSQRG